ncbi:Bile salt-activated lipase [Pseudolycoriella hygida]|uniref:Carboxylic ester hydrolase n=1 Tax=Pseudolycoriella hygida TaxID=35572 RepID=A0A9Q0MQL2_9DIPT|nr:Bile salt-activated lipase [Pseudolycoriella hygida]
MLKIVGLVAFTVATVCTSPFSPINDPLIVETTGGTLRGERLSCGLFCNYFSFKGIPYGKAPVDELRFRAPEPHEGWDGIREANQHTVSCPQNDILGRDNDDEDCLSLNVYTPNTSGRRAVMVWIYGGAFSLGSGDSFIYGPDFIVSEDVVMVTMNYRVGPLGFLSTGDEHATGNYGMKDIILSLKWVKANIARFGGDPDNVTIFGESAGGAAVHYLVLSPLAKGLFQKAISQSGSALNPWAYQTHPERTAHQLAKDLNITFTDNADLIRQLRLARPSDMNRASPGMMSFPIPRGLSSIPFVPCRDPENTDPEDAFLPGEPIDLMNAGNFHDVPYITGFNDAESLFLVYEEILDPNVFNVYNENPHIMIPLQWNVSAGSPESDDIVSKISQFYFQGQPLSTALRYPYTQYNTDLMFARGIDMTAKIHAEKQQEPVFYYLFSFTGALNLLKNLLSLNLYPGAVHADELGYLFQITSIPAPLLPNNPAIRIRRLMCRLWTNFAKTGDPTPPNDPIANVLWHRVSGNQEYYEIGSTVQANANPLGDRMRFWNEMKDKVN